MTQSLAEAEWFVADPAPVLAEVSGGMAHDFNNLLGGLILNLEFLESLVAPADEAADIVHQCLEAAVQGADMTRRLLAVAGRLPLAPRRLALNPLIEALAARRRAALPEGTTLALRLAPDLWPVAVDRVELEASLAALLDNAVDAMPRGGALTVASANSAGFATIEIRDTGCGIAADRLGRVFEPFYTTKARGDGRGLGLAAVAGFVGQSGGRIEIASAPGAGTAIRLSLPRTLDE